MCIFVIQSFAVYIICCKNVLGFLSILPRNADISNLGFLKSHNTSL